jgi:hypothetical protein
MQDAAVRQCHPQATGTIPKCLMQCRVTWSWQASDTHGAKCVARALCRSSQEGPTFHQTGVKKCVTSVYCNTSASFHAPDQLLCSNGR